MWADLCRLIIGRLCTQSKADPLSHIHSLHNFPQCPASHSLSFHHVIHTQSQMFLVFYLWVGILFWFYSSILPCKVSFIFVKRIRGKDTEGTGWGIYYLSPIICSCIQRVASLNFFILCGVMLNQKESK